MKAKKIKAKRYWKTSSGTFLHPDKKSAQYFSGFNAAEVAPVVVLPADLASVEAMVEQMAFEICKAIEGPGVIHLSHAAGVIQLECIKVARAALAAIGIKGGKSK